MSSTAKKCSFSVEFIFTNVIPSDSSSLLSSCRHLLVTLSVLAIFETFCLIVALYLFQMRLLSSKNWFHIFCIKNFNVRLSWLTSHIWDWVHLNRLQDFYSRWSDLIIEQQFKILHITKLAGICYPNSMLKSFICHKIQLLPLLICTFQRITDMKQCKYLFCLCLHFNGQLLHFILKE